MISEFQHTDEAKEVAGARQLTDPPSRCSCGAAAQYAYRRWPVCEACAEQIAEGGGV